MSTFRKGNFEKTLKMSTFAKEKTLKNDIVSIYININF